MIQKIKIMKQFILCPLILFSLFCWFTPVFAADQNKAISPMLSLLLSGKLTGVFLDGPTEGLNYKTNSGIQGLTNSKGEFKYKEGDMVSFFIGDMYLGKLDAAVFAAPFQMDSSSQVLMLIQALDIDNDPSNGIQITKEYADKFRGDTYAAIRLDEVDGDSDSFKTKFKNLTGRDFLVTEKAALEHGSQAVKLEAITHSPFYNYYIDNMEWSEGTHNVALLRSNVLARLHVYVYDYEIKPQYDILAAMMKKQIDSTSDFH